MDVLVERFQRRRIVSDKSSPMLYYLRQKPKTCGTVDIDVLAASIQKNCAMTARHASHDVPLSGCGEVGRLHGEEYLQSEYPLCA